MHNKYSLLFIFSAFAVACGSSDGGNDPNNDPIVTMTGTVDITGDKTASGGFIRMAFTSQPSCAAYAEEGVSPDDQAPEAVFMIPGPVVGDPLEPSGDVYTATIWVPAGTFNGPGTYVNDGGESQIVGQIILEEIPNGPAYFVEDGTATAVINSDGSGSLTFEDLPEDNAVQPTSISGTIEWTCTDEA